jgi:hypothetical protein
MWCGCQGCKDRWVNTETNENCHTACESYKQFRESREQISACKQEYMQRDYTSAGALRAMKRNNFKVEVSSSWK